MSSFGESPYYRKRQTGQYHLADTPANVIEHWKMRAGSIRHPVLKARYADVTWDMARAIADANPDPEMARTAIG